MRAARSLLPVVAALVLAAALARCGAAGDGAPAAPDGGVDAAPDGRAPDDVAGRDLAADEAGGADSRERPDGAPDGAGAVDGDAPPADARPAAPDDAAPGDAALDLGPPDAAPDVDPTLDSDGDGLRDVEELALGTDPLRADSDEDGTPDGVEVADGTDPTDPASARTWQVAALGPPPHVFFGAEDVPVLRARLAAPGAPPWVSAVYGRVRALAQAAPPVAAGEGYDGAVSEVRGRIALAAAFVGLMEQDAALLAKAADLLAAPFPDPRGLDLDAQYNLWESEALNGFCPAWDLLAGSGEVAPGLLPAGRVAAAREGILRRVVAFRQVIYTQPYSVWLSIQANNHSMKPLTAMGLCALALNDQPWAAHGLNEALTGFLFRLLHVQGTPDGGFAEGWNYLNYGANNYLPFLAAYHRFARGRTLPYRHVATFTAAGAPDAGRVVPVPDPAGDERVRAIWLRALWSAFPNGLLPNTDDANATPLHGGLVAALFDDPRFLWNWQLTAVGWFAGAAEVPTLALLDPAMAAAPPDWPLDGVAGEAGCAVFRSDLGEEALWALVQGEHGRVRVNATGHEHPDATNLLLWAGGEPLLIDPGYIDWTQHERVNAATDHNLVLVDGAGPPGPDLGWVVGVDAFLEAEPADAWLTPVVVRATWARTDVQRRVVRVAGAFFLVEDRLDPRDGGEHTYTFQMNGYGGYEVADGAFELLPDGGRWIRPRARVQVAVQPLAGAAQPAERPEEHATGHGTWATHACLTVTASMPAPAGFLSAAVPTRSGSLAPEVATERPTDGVAVVRVGLAAGLTIAVLNRAGAPAAVGGIGPGAAVLTAPVGLSVLVVDWNGVPLHARSFDGGTLYLNNRPLP
jgi:hypothetical protein